MGVWSTIAYTYVRDRRAQYFVYVYVLFINVKMNEKEVNSLVVGYLQSIGSLLATKVKKSLGVGDVPAGSPSLKEILIAGNEALSSPAVKKTKSKVNGTSTPQLNGKAKGKKEESSEDSSSEEEQAPVPVTKKPVAKKPQKEDSSSEESSSEEEAAPPKKAAPAKPVAKPAKEESSEESSEESEDEPAPKKPNTKPVQTKAQPKKESSDEESSSEDEEPAKPAAKAPVAKPTKEESSE